MDQSKMITLYLYDDQGFYAGNGVYDQSASVPGRSTPVAPPVKTGDLYPRFVGGQWGLEEKPVAPVVEPSVPAVVTVRQAKLALLQAGLLDDVEAAIAASADRAVQIEWEYATEFLRDWPALLAMQPALGLTDTQIDDLFRRAATL